MAEQQTPLEIANAQERAIQLGGPDFKLPDGRTVAETRTALLEEHTKEGEAAAATQLKRVREQSIAGDPLYAKGATVVMNAAGGATVVAEPQAPVAEVEKTEKVPARKGGTTAPSEPEHVLDPTQ